MPKTEKDSKGTGYQAPAVHRIFRLLRVVAESPRMMGLAELVQTLGYSKSTTHGLIHALLREGALAQEPDGRRFYLGPAVMDLAFSNWNYLKLEETAQPILNEIRGEIGQTVFLGGLIRKRVLIMAVAEADDPIKISAPAGTTIPLFAGAVGKAFLSELRPEQLDRLIPERGLPRYTPRSILEMDAYLEELEQVRRQGYAVDDEEYITGIRAIAVGLHNRKGPPMAVWVVGLASNLNSVQMRNAIDAVLPAVDRLRMELEKIA
jgi:DNA-binding IclR family transcriptional regulator